MEQSVGQLTATRPEVLEALAGLGIPLATTNYDGLLEEATTLAAVTWRDGAKVERVLRGERKAILHLHGHWEDPASVVLGVRSYEAVWPTPTLRRWATPWRPPGRWCSWAAERAWTIPTSPGCGAGWPECFASPPYRHYRLGLKSELAELWHEHSLAERIVPLPYGTIHDELASFLHLLGLLWLHRHRLTGPPAPGPAPQARLPPPPRCFGRDAIVEDLMTTLLAEPPPPTPVLGPAGVGKSTVCVTALYDQRVAERYWRRQLLRALQRGRVRRGGAGRGGRHPRPAGRPQTSRAKRLPDLAEAPTVLVLDNAETPWWADAAQATREIFATLAAVPGLALIASLPGRQRPFGLA